MERLDKIFGNNGKIIMDNVAGENGNDRGLSISIGDGGMLYIAGK